MIRLIRRSGRFAARASRGSTATTDSSPSKRLRSTRNWPMVEVARYAAIGCSAAQRQVTRRPWRRRSTSAPLAIASTRRGTVIAKSKVALSVGWSLQGNQVGEPCGSPATKAPSSVGIQPETEPSGSRSGRGRPR